MELTCDQCIYCKIDKFKYCDKTKLSLRFGSQICEHFKHIMLFDSAGMPTDNFASWLFDSQYKTIKNNARNYKPV